MIEYLLPGLILILPFQFALNAGENIDLVITRILIPVIFLLWLVRSLAKRKIQVPNVPETGLLVGFLFLSLLSLPLGIEWTAGIRKMLYFLTIIPIYFVAADILREEKNKRVAIFAVWASGVLAAIIALAQFVLPFIIGLDRALKIWNGVAIFFLGSSFGKIVTTNPSWMVNIAGKTWMRAFGFFPDPHVFSFFTSLCLFLGLGYLFGEKKVLKKIIIGAGMGLMLLAIGLSFSRGAYVGILAGLFFFTLIYFKRSGNFGKITVLAGAVLVALLIFYSGAISQRLASAFNPREGSNVERLKNWNQAVEMAKDYPLAGVGLGNYATIVDPTAADRSSIYAHNQLLDIAAETGAANAVVFLALIIISIWHNLKKKDAVGLGIASGLIYFLVHGIFDTAIYSPQALTVLLVVIALGIYPIKRKMPAGGEARLRRQNENVEVPA